MIDGIVNSNLEAVISLTLKSYSGQEMDVETVIDTGFSGYLTLYPSLIESFDLSGAVLCKRSLAMGALSFSMSTLPRWFGMANRAVST